MARGPERPWRALKPPLLDGHILAAIQRGNAWLVENELEAGKTLDTDGARELKQALYRAATRQGVSLDAKIVKDPVNGRLQVQFRVFTKAQARAYMVQKYGTDRTAWPYNPRFRAPREGP